MMKDAESPSAFWDEAWRHPAGHGTRRAGRQAAGLDRTRPHQEPDHRRAGLQPRALAHASLRAAPEPRLFPERFRRPRRQQGDAGGSRSARLGRAAYRRHLVRGRAVGRRGRHLRRRRLAPADSAAGLARGLHRRALLLRAAHQGALHRGGRGALHAGRPHGRQLHQHPHRQALRPRRPRGRLRARRAPGADEQIPGLAAHPDGDGARALHAQRHPDGDGHGPCHLPVDPRPRVASAPSPSSPAWCCASSVCRAGSCGWWPASSRTSAWCRKAWRRSAGTTRSSTGRAAAPSSCARAISASRTSASTMVEPSIRARPGAAASFTTFRCASGPARRWASSAALVPASRRSSTCCCASTTSSRAASSSTDRTSPTSPRTACARRSAW